MTQDDIKLCTTYELSHVVNNFTWFDNRLLQKCKRELDKRHRKALIHRQKKNSSKIYEEKFGSNK